MMANTVAEAVPLPQRLRRTPTRVQRAEAQKETPAKKVRSKRTKSTPNKAVQAINPENDGGADLAATAAKADQTNADVASIPTTVDVTAASKPECASRESRSRSPKHSPAAAKKLTSTAAAASTKIVFDSDSEGDDNGIEEKVKAHFAPVVTSKDNASLHSDSDDEDGAPESVSMKTGKEGALKEQKMRKEVAQRSANA
jgi:hypothetical protein